jgi:hypothetical protein
LRRATAAPCFPSAVLVFFGMCAIVRRFFEALNAFRMFFLAAARCFAVAMTASLPISPLHLPAARADETFGRRAAPAAPAMFAGRRDR